jgi:hypothetical protein
MNLYHTLIFITLNDCKFWYRLNMFTYPIVQLKIIYFYNIYELTHRNFH